jgi:hypothetical protein
MRSALSIIMFLGLGRDLLVEVENAAYVCRLSLLVDRIRQLLAYIMACDLAAGRYHDVCRLVGL